MKIDELKAKQLQARKDKNQILASVLTTLIAEAEKIGKKNQRDPSEEEINKVAQSMIKDIEFTLDLIAMETSAKAVETRGIAVIELCALNDVLPQQLCEDEMMDIIEAFVTDNKEASMGEIMKHFKEEYNGRYNGKELSSLVKRKLK